ncbi:hypothetical protein [Pollutimonas bauzanensis]|uniref:hypothetical protein n=1 Tax=Pollutimonas bauzanensis TaxID=658167 RepID=UPI00333E6E3C
MNQPAPNSIATTSQAISREQLYDAVWSKPATHLAAQYGVSDSFLARVCKRLRVPRPNPGYWAKLAVGKAPSKPGLPAAEPGDETHWCPASPHPAQRRTKPQAATRADTANVATAKPAARESASASAATEPQVDSLHSPTATTASAKRLTPQKRMPATHPLIEGAIGLIPQGRTSREGYCKPRKRLLPDIVTSEEQLETIVRLANKFYRHLEAHGHRVRLSNVGDSFHRQPIDPRTVRNLSGHYDSLWTPERPTVVYVEGIAIGLTLFESLNEQEMQYVRGEYVPVSSLSKTAKILRGEATWTTRRLVPSGEFCLQAYSPYQSTEWTKQWHGTANAMGAQVDEIVATLQAAPPAISTLVEEARLAAEKWRREWDESMARHRREEQAKRHAKAIEASRTELLAIIAEWNESKRIAAFFEEVLAQAEDALKEVRVQIANKLAAAQRLWGGKDALARLAKWHAPDDINETLGTTPKQ